MGLGLQYIKWGQYTTHRRKCWDFRQLSMAQGVILETLKEQEKKPRAGRCALPTFKAGFASLPLFLLEGSRSPTSQVQGEAYVPTSRAWHGI